MQKTSSLKLLFVVIFDVIFCISLILAFAFILFKTGINSYKLTSYLILLSTGIFSGFLTSNTFETKKLLKSYLVSTVFFIIYLACCLNLNEELLETSAYLASFLNVYFGTFLGILLSINRKPKRRKKWNISKHWILKL